MVPMQTVCDPAPLCLQCTAVLGYLGRLQALQCLAHCCERRVFVFPNAATQMSLPRVAFGHAKRAGEAGGDAEARSLVTSTLRSCGAPRCSAATASELSAAFCRSSVSRSAQRLRTSSRRPGAKELWAHTENPSQMELEHRASALPRAESRTRLKSQRWTRARYPMHTLLPS